MHTCALSIDGQVPQVFFNHVLSTLYTTQTNPGSTRVSFCRVNTANPGSTRVSLSCKQYLTRVSLEKCRVNTTWVSLYRVNRALEGIMVFWLFLGKESNSIAQNVPQTTCNVPV